MDDLSSYKTLYISTAKTNIGVIKNALVVLVGDMSNEQAIEEVFRNAHTLKSKSLMMGHVEISNLAKSIEDLFSAVVNKKTTLSESSLEMITKQAAEVEKLLLQIDTKI